MKHIKSHIELDNDEIVEYISSILIDLDDLENVTHEIVFYNSRTNGSDMVYWVDNNIGTYKDKHRAWNDNLDSPIDRVDLILNVRGRNCFNYSDIKGVVDHINSYLWERGFAQDWRTSSYKTKDVGIFGKSCILVDFDDVKNITNLCVSFKKKK